METVLVTGAAGYIGTTLVPKLLEAGYHVVALDRFRHRSPGLLACCNHPEFKTFRADCRDLDAIFVGLRKADWVIPLAAIVGAPACDANETDANTTNFLAIKKLLDVRGKHDLSFPFPKIPKVIFPTTTSGYGSMPNNICDEDTPFSPVSHYGKTKADAERYVLNSPNTLSLRLATCFGASPRMRLDLLVNDFTYRAVRDRGLLLYEPNFHRNFLHVRDAADAILFAMKHFEMMKGKPYNVGIPGALSKKDLCEVIKVVVSDFRYAIADTGTDPDKRDYDVSVDRIFKLGYRPQIGLLEGIRELVKAYQMLPGPEFTNL